MKQRFLFATTATLGLGAMVSGPRFLAAQSSPNNVPGASASSIVSATAPSASASATASAPALPTLVGKDLPEGRSELPTLAEWKEGVPFTANRPDLPCDFKRLREYVQITCRYFAGAGLFAGNPKDVTVFASGDTFDAQEKWTPPITIIVLPIRRNESRLLNLLSIGGGGYDMVTGRASAWISVSWRDGDPDPMILTRLDGSLENGSATGI